MCWSDENLQRALPSSDAGVRSKQVYTIRHKGDTEVLTLTFSLIRKGCRPLGEAVVVWSEEHAVRNLPYPFESVSQLSDLT